MYFCFLEENPALPSASILSALNTDDEDEEDIANVNKANRSLTKKKVKRLVLSDDESDNEDVAQPDEESDIQEQTDDEQENKEVMYDSEENEIDPSAFKGFRGKAGYVILFCIIHLRVSFTIEWIDGVSDEILMF